MTSIPPGYEEVPLEELQYGMKKIIAKKDQYTVEGDVSGAYKLLGVNQVQLTAIDNSSGEPIKTLYKFSKKDGVTFYKPVAPSHPIPPLENEKPAAAAVAAVDAAAANRTEPNNNSGGGRRRRRKSRKTRRSRKGKSRSIRK